MVIKASERMVVRASRELQDQEIVFVGIGLPNLACNLARETHAPELFLIYESGAVGAIPERLPVSIGDPALVTNSLSVVSQADIFQTYLQAGLIGVGFLGGAQIDRFGNINTTVIGPYANPQVRLPGSGGACEIATHAKKTLILMNMTPKSFVEKCDFITSPGHHYISKVSANTQLWKESSRGSKNLPGRGPLKVITDLGVLEYRDGEMVVTEIFEDTDFEKMKSQCGWPLKSIENPQLLSSPSIKILNILREKLDPEGLYL